MSHVVDGTTGRYVRVGDRMTRVATGDPYWLVAVASPDSLWVADNAELDGVPTERFAWLFGMEVVR